MRINIARLIFASLGFWIAPAIHAEAPAVMSDMSFFLRLGEFYSRGDLPDFADFDPAHPRQGESAQRTHPDIRTTVSLITLEANDPTLGVMKYIGTFRRAASGKPDPVAEWQSTLRSDVQNDRISSLVVDANARAFTFAQFINHPKYCENFERWRRVVSAPGTQALVGEVVQNDGRDNCTDAWGPVGTVVMRTYISYAK